MTLPELRAAIKQAREVRAYVPMGEYFLEVKVAKVQLTAVLDKEIEHHVEWGAPFPKEHEAYWDDEDSTVLVVGGLGDPEED
jgi:hypothetical protein